MDSVYLYRMIGNYNRRQDLQTFSDMKLCTFEIAVKLFRKKCKTVFQREFTTTGISIVSSEAIDFTTPA